MPTIERIFNKMRFGVLTVSDSCYKQQNVDKSGPQITALIKSRYAESIVIYEDIVPDELERIKAKLTEWSDDICDVVFTTGGTGIADRDVTPEATKAIIDKEVPGISFVMMNKSLASTPFAMLSRAVCGIRKKTLIINFPGSVKAVTENFEAICEIIPHAISLLQNKIEDIQKIHSRLAQLPQIQPRPEHVTLVPDAISLQNKIEDVQKINSRIAHFSQLQPRPENITLVPATSATTFLTPSNVIINTANRPRTSPYEMVSMDNALGIVTMNCGQTANTEVFPIINLMGRVLAEDIRSRDPLPPFAASIKDGYAVKSSDGAGLRTVVDAKAAGDNPKCPELQSGQCVRISTGAAVPPGADAVVQVEDTELVKSSEDSTQELQINIKVAPKLGQDIRPIGSDIPANTIVLPKGSIINASEIGVLAAVGQTRASVFKPRNPQKRTFLNQESRDIVKNIIFYFDQQKNAGGFLYPIEKPTEAAAAAAGIARSTVIKMRKEIKKEITSKSTTNDSNEDNEDVIILDEGEDIINEENIPKNTETNLNTEENENIEANPLPEMKTRIRKLPMTKQSRRKSNPKEPERLNSSKIKITKDDITMAETEGSTVIEIQEDDSNFSNPTKKIRLMNKNETETDNNLSPKVKIIRNKPRDSLSETTNIKKIIIDNIGSEHKPVKRIQIETRKSAFLSENTEKLAAAVGVNPDTIKLIKSEVLADKTKSQLIKLTNNKVLKEKTLRPIAPKINEGKVKIIKKKPIILNKPTIKTMGSIILSKKDFEEMSKKGQKINIMQNNLIQSQPDTISAEISIEESMGSNSEISILPDNIITDIGNEILVDNSETSVIFETDLIEPNVVVVQENSSAFDGECLQEEILSDSVLRTQC